MKYIITKDYSPILFSNAISHIEMANKFGGALSAGMCSISEGEGTDEFGGTTCYLSVRCYGKSVTLGMIPAEGDKDKITRMIEEY